MYSLNRAQIIGNLTRDPEMRFTPNGQAVCSFAVATNRRWKDKDGSNQEATEFHDIVAWGKLGEIMSQILHKGDKVYIEGRLQTRSWDAQDGSKRQRTEVITEDFVALSPKGSINSTSTSNNDESKEFPIGTEKEKKTVDQPVKKEEAAADEEINLDDIPF